MTLVRHFVRLALMIDVDHGRPENRLILNDPH
ncbi:hypothetical protein FHW68_001600 [Pseudomonas sp. Tn43]|nr:hypothetical protein [Pseudomonas sp. Tn43]